MRIFAHPTTQDTVAVYSDEEAEALPAPWTEISLEAYESILASRQVADPAPLPRVVTMRQARLALLGEGLLSQVEAAIDALPSPQKDAARIEWEYSQEVHRDRPFVQTLGVAIGLSDEQLDALFTAAAGL